MLSAKVHSRSRIPGEVDSRIYGFSPASIAGLQRWFSASDLSLNEDDPVTVWYDKSGNAGDAVQSDPGYRPSFTPVFSNNKPSLLFYLTEHMDFGNFGVTNYTYFIVMSRFSSTDDSVILANTDSQYTYLQYGDNWFVQGDALSVPMENEVPEIKGGVVSGTSLRRFTNGIEEEETAGGTSSAFRYIGLPAYTCSCWIAEVLIYNVALSDNDRQSIETYLSVKYNL
jgi:hypothetical protein